MRALRLVPLAVLALTAWGCDSDSEPGPPTRAEITQVVVLDVPLVDPANGNRWDGNSDGDVYFRLYEANDDFRDLSSGESKQGEDFGDDRFNARDDGNVNARSSGGTPWYDDVETIDLPLIWDVDGPYVVRDLDDQLFFGLADYDSGSDDDPMGETELFVLDDFAPAIVTGQAKIITLDGVGAGGEDVRVQFTVTFRD